MTPNQRVQMLSEIAALQGGDGSYDDTFPPADHDTGTAPVTIRIGYVDANGQVRDNGIEILRCPPAVLTRVMQVADAMTPQHVLVEVADGVVRIW